MKEHKQLYKKLFSRNKEIIKETLKELKKMGRENSIVLNGLAKKLLNSYDSSDKNNVKITIRGLNKCLYFGIDIKLLENYADILLENITHKDGKVRTIVIFVIRTFGTHLEIPLSDAAIGIEPKLYSDKELEELAGLSVNFYLNLTKLYEEQNNEKIKSSILSCIKRFHHLAGLMSLIAKGGYHETYQKFNRLIY